MENEIPLWIRHLYLWALVNDVYFDKLCVTPYPSRCQMGVYRPIGGVSNYDYQTVQEYIDSLQDVSHGKQD
jgi:hypothetical protein